MEVNRDNKKGTNNDNCLATWQVTVSKGVRAIASEEVLEWAIKRHICDCLGDPQGEIGDAVSYVRNSRSGASFIIATESLTSTIAVMLPEEFHGTMM